jgi:peptidyl-tRNA hydrolase
MSGEPRKFKMWLAVRCDLDLYLGKLATQAGHAYQWLTIRATQETPEALRDYLIDGQP